jgi:hypothetical protein
MKVILEAADLIRILGAHFGAEFDPENVTIKTDPFEVEVRGIPLPESERGPMSVPRAEPTVHRSMRHTDPESTIYNTEDTALVAARADGDASAEPPPPGTDATVALDASGSPLALIEQSKQLEAELDRNRSRQRRGGSSKPPGDFRDEVS